MSVEEVVTVFSESDCGLDKQLNQLLSQGWQLRGNLIVYKHGFVQQMVRVHTDAAAESAKPSKS